MLHSASTLTTVRARCCRRSYNPINNFWVVPPSNPRIVNGLTFAPATLFCRTTPATIRTK